MFGYVAPDQRDMVLVRISVNREVVRSNRTRGANLLLFFQMLTLNVGRTRRLRQRLRQHSVAGAQHNQVVFAFQLAREMTGRLTAAYSAGGSRAALSANASFANAFTRAKSRVRGMDLRFVEEPDPLRQA